MIPAWVGDGIAGELVLDPEGAAELLVAEDNLEELCDCGIPDEDTSQVPKLS